MNASSDTSDRDLTDQLRADLVEGVFTPGQRLVEHELTARYGYGRTSVRASLQRLEAEGLVERETNKGATVRRLSLAEAIEVTEARAVLEGLLAARAAERAEAEDAARLEALLARMGAAVAADDARAYGQLNRELHDEIHDLAGHEVARSLVRNLRDRGVHHRFRPAMLPGRAKWSLTQHEAIVAAIARGDAVAASAAMHDHLDSVLEVLRDWGDAL